ncbi:MAG: DUF1585 domain-containing protein, partial [Myxococcales bacterium]|nr:DUF1585 domain-containing protein [Myxococcales bacterium]
PALRNCMPGGSTQLRMITDAMVKDIDLRVAELVETDGSYLDLFTSAGVWVNGPLVHYWRYLTAFPRMSMSPAPIDVDRLPDLAFTDVDTWVKVQMGPEQAGILTSPAFLLRFQTNRARANRFYNSFLCQAFNAPSGGIPVVAGAAAEPDLQIRAGCEYCHALLEPAASHWGRWGERGASRLAEDAFPPFDDSCELCATSGLPCSRRCQDFYVTQAFDDREAPYLGWLKSYLFRRPEHEHYVEEGPKLLVYSTLVDGRFERCAVRTAAEHLLGRALDKGEDALVDDVAREFIASGYKYRALVKALVTHPTYRRVR